MTSISNSHTKTDTVEKRNIGTDTDSDTCIGGTLRTMSHTNIFKQI